LRADFFCFCFRTFFCFGFLVFALRFCFLGYILILRKPTFSHAVKDPSLKTALPPTRSSAAAIIITNIIARAVTKNQSFCDITVNLFQSLPCLTVLRLEPQSPEAEAAHQAIADQRFEGIRLSFCRVTACPVSLSGRAFL